MGVLVRDDEDTLHLSARHDRRRGHADHLTLAGRDQHPPELAAARAFGGGQVELDEKGATGGVGHRRHLDDSPLDRRGSFAHPNGKFGPELDVADERLRDVGLEAQRAGIFHLDDRFAGRGEIADVGQLARHDPVEGRDDFRVAKQRLHLARHPFSDARPRLHGVELSLRRDLFVEQLTTSREIARRLFAQSQRLIELGLNLARVELRDQISSLHRLPRRDQEQLDATAHFRFDHGMQLRPHSAHDLLAGSPGLALGYDRADCDRGQRLRAGGFLFRMTRDERQGRRDGDKQARKLHRHSA